MYVHRMSREIVIQYKHTHYFKWYNFYYIDIVEALAILSIVIKLYWCRLQKWINCNGH